MLELAICTHRGSSREQQDAALIGTRAIQSAHTLYSEQLVRDELLVGIADGVATSPAAALASRRYLVALANEVKAWTDAGRPEPLSARQIRAAHQVFCDELTRKRSSFGASTTLVAAHIVSTIKSRS